MLRALLLGLLAWPAFAQEREAVQAPPQPEEEEPRWFASSGEIPLNALLDACSATLSLSIDYDRERLQRSVSLRSPDGLTNEALWRLTNRILIEEGLACVQPAGEDGLTIVELDKASQIARTEPGELEDARAGYVKVLRHLRQAEARTAASILGSVLTVEGSVVQPIPDAEEIILAGPKHQVAEALAVLELIDRPFGATVVEEIPTTNLPPTVIVTLVERITAAIAKVTSEAPRGTALANPGSDRVIVVAPEDEVAFWRETIERFDKAETILTVHYQPRRFGLDETAQLIEEVVQRKSMPGVAGGGWAMIQDELTGTLIISATHSQHLEVEKLLARLESTQAGVRREMRAFAVKHRDVQQLLEVVRGLLERGGGLPVGEDGGALPGSTGGAVVRPGESEGEITLTLDAQTNRILAVGPPRTLDELEALIRTLDVQHPQVLVETLIVSLNANQSRDLAFELQKLGTLNGATGRLSSLFGAGAPNVAGSTLPTPGGTGLEGVILDPGSFSAVVRALETVNRGRTLTIPKVLVNNNQTADLNSVLQTPFTSTNASNTVATTSFGGTQDAGTIISVTPQITDGDQLLLDYSISISSFVGQASDPALPPPRQENSLKSVATVPDGYAVVVGGLEIETESETESKVPILGDLPLVGTLFGSRSEGRTKSRFFVFIRCNVLRHPSFEDLRHASKGDREMAGIEDDLPPLEPRWIQ